MRNRFSPAGHLAVMAAAAVVVAGCGGDDSEDKPKPEPPPASVSTDYARTVDLDTPRKKVAAQLGPPYRTEKQKVGRRVVDLTKFPAGAEERFRKKYDVPAGRDTITFPPETYRCLIYAGEDAVHIAWRFCFNRSDRLQYVSTQSTLDAAN